MRYLFIISGTDDQPERSAEASITNKRHMPLDTDLAESYGENPPVAQWTVDVVDPATPEGFPIGPVDDEYLESIDAHAWRGLLEAGERRDCFMLEWADGSVEVTLPEHDVPGISAKPAQAKAKFTLAMVREDHALRDDLWTEWRITNQGNPLIDNLPAEPPEPPTDEGVGEYLGFWDDCLDFHNTYARLAELTEDQLRSEVIQQRLDACFGDGMEREYAEAGVVAIGEPVRDMNAAQMIRELMGIDPVEPECEHEHSHLNNEVTAHRFCNDCRQEVHVDPSSPHAARWKFVDEVTYLWADGAGQGFVRQVWAMLDTRTLEDLKVLGGPNFGR